MTGKKSKVPPPPRKRSPVPPPPKKKVSKSNIVPLEKGLMPPQAVELEQVILGAFLADKNAISEVRDILEPEYFYKEDHQIIYKSIQYMDKKNLPIDLLTVSNELNKIGKLGEIGGDFYLIGLTQRVASSAHIEYHARIVIQMYIKRRLIARGNVIIEEAYKSDADIFDIMENVSDDINEITANVVKASSGMKRSAKEELRAKVEARRKGEDTGFYLNVPSFDEWSGGIQPREVVTIAARPGMGKTTLLLSVAKTNADRNIPTAIFSLEMSEADLKSRLASAETKVEYINIRKGDISLEELEKIEAYYDFLDNSAIHIVEKTFTLEAIITKIRELVLKYGIKAVLIDYVQLMTLTRKTANRTDDLNTITRTLKQIANELDIPMIILAQLSRKVDDRPGNRPNLSDLKQSGSIEEDSDIVAFLLRMAAYRQQKGEMVPPHEVGITEFIIAKGRSTGLRNFKINFDFRTFQLNETF